MNKKKLSVVMAGAMLASSVAPVLAAETSELDSSQLGSLVEKVQAKLTEARFDSNDDTQIRNAVSALSGATSVGTKTVANKSLYYISIKDAEGNVDVNEMLAIYEATEKGSEKALRTALQNAFQKLTSGSVVEIWEVGSTKNANGEVVASVTAKSVPKYTAEDFKLDANNNQTPDIKEEIVAGLTKNSSAFVQESNITVGNNKVVIKFEKGVDLTNPNFASVYKNNISKDADTSITTLTLGVGDNKLDFTHYLDTDDALTDAGTEIGNSTATAGNLVKGFPQKSAKATTTDIAGKLLETIEITGKENNYKTEDLYDGLMLTTEGHDLLSLVKAADKKSGYTVALNSLDGTKIEKNESSVTLEPNKAGKYGFVITIVDKKGNTTKYTVSGAKAQTSRVATWFSQRLAKVDILAGDNRYETAVSVAREQLKMAPGYLGDFNNDATISNIVLVNGKSLVDGLAAAPLASHLTANTDDDVAPVLLTEADALPKATKEFLKEILANKKIGDVDTTIHLVGGTTVLSRSLEKELRSYGFEIKRYNGANREETSLEVAEEINNSNEAFVVGANGEADAMSIAPVAADKANSTSKANATPIIVAKKGGISYEALDELEGKDVTVVGGELSVSKEDYEAIEEAVGKNGTVERVAGDNRQQTNAKILEKYYKAGTVDSVIVSKDGRGNNEELVDALTVANLAVQKNAPVVLAKSSLSAEQLNMVNLYGKSSDSLYQVGHGVDRDNVIKVLADRLGLTD